MIWTQGALPYSKVRSVRLLRPPFSCSLLAQLSLKILLCHSKIPCVLGFWSKVTNLSHNDPNVFDFLDKKWQVCSKYTKLLKNFHPNLWKKKKHFVWNFWKDTLFCVKPHFSPADPSCLRFLPHQVPLTLKIGAELSFQIVPQGI